MPITVEKYIPKSPPIELIEQGVGKVSNYNFYPHFSHLSVYARIQFFAVERIGPNKCVVLVQIFFHFLNVFVTQKFALLIQGVCISHHPIWAVKLRIEQRPTDERLGPLDV